MNCPGAATDELTYQLKDSQFGRSLDASTACMTLKPVRGAEGDSGGAHGGWGAGSNWCYLFRRNWR